jgi:hypothetical protein
MKNATLTTVISKEVTPLTQNVSDIVIKTPDDLSGATAILSKLNQALDRVTEEKERITKPLNEALKAERSRWKPLEALLESSITTLKGKMSSYQQLALQAQQKAQESITKKVQAGKLSIDKAIAKMEDLPSTSSSVSTDAGSIKFKVVKKFEVSDLSLLPLEYHLSNDVLIRKAMLANIELPGVRYFEEQQVNNYR